MWLMILKKNYFNFYKIDVKANLRGISCDD